MDLGNIFDSSLSLLAFPLKIIEFLENGGSPISRAVRLRLYIYLYIIIKLGIQYSCIFIRFTLDYKNGKLPVLDIDGKELTQSLAIGRFLGKKYKLVAEDPFLDARADEVINTG